MKVKNINIINYDAILGRYVEKRLPQKISFAITKNLFIIAKELEPYRKSLQKIIDSYEDYQVKDDKGELVNLDIGIPKVDKEHEKDYFSEVEELLNIEVEIELYQIDADAFDYPDSERYDAMSAKDIVNLQSVLCKQDSEETEKVSK